MIEYEKKYNEISKEKNYNRLDSDKMNNYSKLEKNTFLGADIGSTI